MELKLNIYKGRNIEKTYTAEEYELLFGTVEDILNVIDIDAIKTGSDEEIIKVVGNAVVKSMDIIKPLIKEVFEGITDDELKHTKVTELALVVVDIVKYTIAEISKGATGKN